MFLRLPAIDAESCHSSLHSARVARNVVFGLLVAGDVREAEEFLVTKNSLPTCKRLRAVLREAQQSDNGGLGFHMWGTVVDRNGVVVAIAYTGERLGDQWPGSRIISAQKANAANSLSLDTFALSTANLYSAVQPGGTLFGLEDTNPVNPEAVYGGDPEEYGTSRDFLIGRPRAVLTSLAVALRSTLPTVGSSVVLGFPAITRAPITTLHGRRVTCSNSTTCPAVSTR